MAVLQPRRYQYIDTTQLQESYRGIIEVGVNFYL